MAAEKNRLAACARTYSLAGSGTVWSRD